MKDKIKKFSKIGMIYIFTFVILLSIYMILLTISSLIPSSLLENNVRKSSETLVKEGERPTYDLKYKEESIFTFTDALMINTAYSVNHEQPIESFILAKKNYIPGQTKVIYYDSQPNLGANEKYKNKRTGDIYQTKELYGLMHGENIEDSYEYARYWHGYLVILRPLLILFDYNAIRIVLFVFTLTCVGVMTYLLYKKINLKSAIVFIIGLLSINIWLVTKSINEILIFLVGFIATSILLLKKDKIKHIGVFFFIVGSVSNFIDLLTSPIVTLGMTALTYFLLLQKEENMTTKRYLIELLKIGIAWSLGYGITWGAKWVITQVFFHRPIITQVIDQIIFRSKSPIRNGVTVISGWSVINKNLTSLSKTVVLSIITIATIYASGIIILKKEKINFKENVKKCIPYIAIFFFPIVWFIAVKQHSYTHAFFVHRILVISIISLLLVVIKLFEEEEGVKK